MGTFEIQVKGYTVIVVGNALSVRSVGYFHVVYQHFCTVRLLLVQ